MDMMDREDFFRRIENREDGLGSYPRDLVAYAFDRFIDLGGKKDVSGCTIALAILQGMFRLAGAHAEEGWSSEEATRVIMSAVWTTSISVPERNDLLAEVKRQVVGLSAGLAEHRSTVI